MKKKKRRKEIEVEDIDITSLLDILVILLVFLLQSFNDGALKVDLVNDLNIPFSTLTNNTTFGPTVQVDKNKNVFIEGSLMGTIDKINNSKVKKTFVKFIESNKVMFSKPIKDDAGNDQDRDPRKLVNILLDKTLVYKDIQKVLDICAESEFKKFKLIVQGDE